ncbi:helix-turn-helix domain-containing protein [Pontixanthobacter sp. CEM42]|uniref:helix-turn-helix transcriptional regulator n=1 Tax=Pontixanthobacter sp. CEM42 TaxID=2792077 RepID=UPI001ADFECE4|nr:helix-turn-helix domain-containing protein [Pontixanthobacter sp. CEM42]
MPKLFTRQQAADYLGISYSTLCRWAYLGEGPSFCRVGKQPRYRMADLEQYLELQQTG